MPAAAANSSYVYSNQSPEQSEATKTFAQVDSDSKDPELPEVSEEV
jgi:hypothetical protein